MLIVAVALSLSSHVLLDEPARRYDDMKQGPCGRGGGEDGRTERVTRYAPGETITMRWIETIDHEGTWVVAFDDDGADEADFEANIIATFTDPENISGLPWQEQVTLPDVECTNCTLRLLQIMTTSPNPRPSDLYFQCADIVLGDGDSAPAEVSSCAPVTAARSSFLPSRAL